MTQLFFIYRAFHELLSFYLIFTNIPLSGLYYSHKMEKPGLREVTYCPTLPTQKEAVVGFEPYWSELTIKHALCPCAPRTLTFSMNGVHLLFDPELSNMSWFIHGSGNSPTVPRRKIKSVLLNKLRVAGGWRWEGRVTGWWALRMALDRMSTGCYIQQINH